MSKRSGYIRWFEELSIDDVPLVGGKNASLGELYGELTHQGINVPNGFAITADAYRAVLEQSGAWDALKETFCQYDLLDQQQLAICGQHAREIVYQAALPQQLLAEILTAYHQLQVEYGMSVSIAVRSSATAEDLPSASFAGQHDSFLNITGDDALIDACRRCFASVFTDRAIQYRINNHFDHFKVYLSIGVMKMVRADKAASGVMFSLDTESGNRGVVFITGAYGLGDNVVQGLVDPDEFYVHKLTFNKGYHNVLRRSLGEKHMQLVYCSKEEHETTKNVETPIAMRQKFCITDEEVVSLAGAAIRIEQHYSNKFGREMPMDMEWAKDAKDGKLYIVQARPETVISQDRAGMLHEYVLKERSEVLVSGKSVGSKIATGPVRVIKDTSELDQFVAGEVLVAKTTTPDWGPVMKLASAIVTDRGGRTCHAAIVARELGVPAIVGTHNGTGCVNTGESVTVSCAEGDVGYVYKGSLAFDVKVIDLGELKKTKTQIMMNLANPGSAFMASMIPNDGVGLARLEFIIGETIQAHPMALIHPEEVADNKAREKIRSLTSAYSSPAEFFIEKLTEGVGTIAAAFYPKPVIVRLSDFKSNEYANLLGGSAFEPDEENPMLGFRGASRYIHPQFCEAFALECKAMKHVRETMGFKNVKLMIPFCRRLQEARRVIELLAHNGLSRGDNELEIYMMCEIPNNVLLIDEFSEYFDGFSIGSNDLTQLVLGVDRDSALVADDFDERDAGVKKMLKMAIEGAQRNNKYVGICGQAPSDYPEMAQYLVTLGIDSLSLNPDSVVKTMIDIAQLEEKIL